MIVYISPFWFDCSRPCALEACAIHVYCAISPFSFYAVHTDLLFGSLWRLNHSSLCSILWRDFPNHTCTMNSAPVTLLHYSCFSYFLWCKIDTYFDLGLILRRRVVCRILSYSCLSYFRHHNSTC